MATVELEIFKAGRRKAANGTVATITNADLDQVVDSFDPALYSPPLIFTHKIPKSLDDRDVYKTKFAFGVPEQLKRVGKSLKAVFDADKICPQFKEWVRDRNLLGKSASFYTPNYPDNPTPGKWHLRHIAALGNEPPAVKGLKPLQEEFNFSEAEGILSFSAPANEEDFLEFSWFDSQIPSLFQRLREYVLERDGAETADKVVPTETLQILTQALMSDQEPWEQINQLWEEVHKLKACMNHESSMPTYSEGSMNSFQKLLEFCMASTGKDAQALSKATGISLTDLEPRLQGTTEFSEAEAAAVVQALSYQEQPSARELELEQQLREAQLHNEQARRAEIVSFAEGLASEDKAVLLPGEVAGQVRILEALFNSAQTVEFAEGETLSAFEAHKRFLAGLGKRIDYGEVAPGLGEEAALTVEFSEAPGYTVSTEKQALYNKAVAYQRQHPDVELIEAYKAVGGR